MHRPKLREEGRHHRQVGKLAILFPMVRCVLFEERHGHLLSRNLCNLPVRAGKGPSPVARRQPDFAAPAGSWPAGSWTRKKMAYATGVTMRLNTAAHDSPNMMHTAIDPKNGSVSSGIIPSTVVSTTMHTGRSLLVPPSRIA